MNIRMTPDAVTSILIIRFQHLGDLVFVMALAQNLRLAYPHARITVVCSPAYAELLRQQPELDAVITIPARSSGLISGIRGWATTLWSMITGAFDLVIDLSDNRRSTLLTRLTGARVRIGYEPPDRYPARRGFLERGVYNEFAAVVGTKWDESDEQLDHYIGRYLAPLKTLGLPVVRATPKLTITEADWIAVQTILNEAGVGGRPYTVIHPGASKPTKRWPTRHFPRVIEHLARHGIDVVMVGDGADAALAGEIAALSPSTKFASLVGKLTLGQLAAVLEHCALYIGHNTGPTHVAAAVGAPVIAIYGIHASLWGPLSDRRVVVSPARPCQCVDPATCRPNDPNGSLCVQRNSVADVLRAIDAQLGTQPPAP
jgi:heptosyltransferase-3